MYNIKGQSSFEDLDYRSDKFQDNNQRVYTKNINIPMILLGNKNGLNNERIIKTEKGKEKA